jgi:hypothetical protein
MDKEWSWFAAALLGMSGNSSRRLLTNGAYIEGTGSGWFYMGDSG